MKSWDRIYSKESVPMSALNCLNSLPDGVLTTHSGRADSTSKKQTATQPRCCVCLAGATFDTGGENRAFSKGSFAGVMVVRGRVWKTEIVAVLGFLPRSAMSLNVELA